MRNAVRVEGLQELETAMKELTAATRRNVGRRTLAKAARPFLDRARQLAPDGDPSAPGLKESLVVAARMDPRYRDEPAGPGEVVRWIGPAGAPHAHLVEFGTGPRRHRSGKYVGVMPPKPFLRPAWDATKGLVLDRIATILADEIEKSVARARRKAARAKAG